MLTKLLEFFKEHFTPQPSLLRKSCISHLSDHGSLMAHKSGIHDLLKDILALERVQRRAIKYITGDFTSDYKSRLITLNILPFMYFLELSDIMFFVNSVKYPSSNFNILDFVSFSSASTRSSTFNKLCHTKSSNMLSNFHFNRLPRLWNSLPPIDLTLSSSTIKSKIIQFFWSHFHEHFQSDNPCTFHFFCPCAKCKLTCVNFCIR